MSDWSTANRERELGLDPCKTDKFHPTDELGAAAVIDVSTRGTRRSDSWKMLLSEKANAAKLPPAGSHLNVSKLESALVKQCFTPFWWRPVMFHAFALVTCEWRLVVK